MNIAYTFHGHSRTWQQCYQSFFDNVFNEIPGDIFIHTWDQVNATTGSYWNGWHDLTGEALEKSKAATDVNGIIKTYQPKVIIVENHPEVIVPETSAYYIENRARYGVKNMLYGSRKIFEEAVKYKKYDFIINTRMDIKYLSKFDKAELNSNLNFALDNNSWDFKDIIMWGTPELLDIKTQYYHNIDSYWYNLNNERHDWIHTGYEPQLKYYLMERKMPLASSNLKIELVRLF